MDLCSRDSGVQLNLSAIDSCDAAGIQLLCSAQKTALCRGRAFSLQTPSAAVLKAFQSVGLDINQFKSETREEKL